MTFQAFYNNRRNRDPFPWMVRLAEAFEAFGPSRPLPDVIDLPTGSGKSDLVFAWAWARTRNPNLPRRLWMVSDRRVIVDQTYQAARLLAGDAKDPHGILVSQLRGGIVRDDADLLDPVRPQIIASTVDQIGSRLLFRAYGSSPRSWPIWAGLAGNDSLIVLDEAHLSPVAEETMRACRRHGAAIQIISMTATPRASPHSVFSLDAADRDHPILAQRLAAKRLVELRSGGSLAAAAQDFLSGGARRVAVVCNTVRAAREAFNAIAHPDKHLVIGRQRGVVRERSMPALLERVRSGAAPSEPLVVVSTQCIEAGADFSFDAMVSEACPIDALMQRLGRLDRLGERGTSHCVMIRPPQFKLVPPYGNAPEATWKWLSKHAKKSIIDLGGDNWATISATVPEEARSSRPESVTLLEPHVRMLTRTSPRPRIEPDVDLLLHGHDSMPGAVQIIWRDDVDVTELEAANEILQILPPEAGEAVEVPLWEVCAWLDATTLSADGGDVEGGFVPAPSIDRSAAGRRAIRWEGQDEPVTPVRAADLRPGDIIVVPSEYGGCDAFGWAPAATVEVSNVIEDAFHLRTRRFIGRYKPSDEEVLIGRRHVWSGGVVVETLEAKASVEKTEIELEPHQGRVAACAADYAKAIGLDAALFALAGRLHDEGKREPFWQLSINGGDDQRAINDPLAKGKTNRFVRHPLSRLPVGWRHEARSVELLPPDTDDLVRWLIATHHGHARPFWPIPDHGRGLADMMDRLQATHGYWRLALFEAVLRCADRAVSKEEQSDA